MKKIIIIQVIIILLAVMKSNGQTKLLNLDEIKSIANSDKYTELFKRYQANDTTLLTEDYRNLYFGNTFRASFKANDTHDSEAVLMKYMNTNGTQANFNKVLSYTKLILKDFPYSLKMIGITTTVYGKHGNKKALRLWYYKYMTLIDAILSTGDGKTPQTAFVVTSTTDEHTILEVLGLKFLSQSLEQKNGKTYDLMKVEKNQNGVEAVYFDVSLFFGKI
jgi:hypothetical protein